MTALNRYFPAPDETPTAEAATLSAMALGMKPSKILVIAYAVRARIDAGAPVVNFTVGDFAPRHFPVPDALKQGIIAAVEDDQTNYPPAHGIPELRAAIQRHYADDLGLDYPEDAIVVASGARPALYAAYQCLIDPGEVVVTPAPSWNNDNFSQLVGGRHVVVPSRPEDGFMPTAEALAPALRDARLLVLNSPMNPAGTMLREAQLRAICDVVLTENARRAKAGQRALYLVYDHVYRMLAFKGREHFTPVQLAPEMARYTLYVDAISKCFASTGLRVGWMLAPPFITARIRALMTHMGAWAPRPEQHATAKLLGDRAAIDAYLGRFRQGLEARLDRLFKAFAAWKAEGLPVDAIAPEGAIYLSVHFDLEGRPGFADEDAVLEWLLDEAGCAVVPFSAFGDHTNRGWFRFSVGAVGEDEIEACLPRLYAALTKVARA
ncbi:MAG: aminotransferase class I/II-fold pyridoxal phosphate-dependent enzyme [Myxococcales bacterium]|nr:aminotransferase class I/II-fold pyridoxal phosphate-dependent enzyme [Myxococcales bacterium]